MRRDDRQLKDRDQIEEILRQNQVLRLALVDGGAPYIVPLNFGYAWDDTGLSLYIHCAKEGKKVDLLRQSPKVCVEIDDGHALIEGPVPCKHSFRYRSFIGWGEAVELEAPAEKASALSMLMGCLTGKNMPVSEEQSAGVLVFQIRMTEFTAKVRA